MSPSKHLKARLIQRQKRTNKAEQGTYASPAVFALDGSIFSSPATALISTRHHHLLPKGKPEHNKFKLKALNYTQHKLSQRIDTIHLRCALQMLLLVCLMHLLTGVVVSTALIAIVMIGSYSPSNYAEYMIEQQRKYLERDPSDSHKQSP